MARTQTQTYFVVRGVVRFVFGLIAVLAAYVGIHLLALNFWTALVALVVTVIGIKWYDQKTGN